jgi:hypothetical protein
MTTCVIGAGAAGLAAARHLPGASIPFEVVEREGDVGGIWDASLPYSPVYHSAHLISSKPLTQFPDFPMPRDYPDYPGNAEALAYLRAYAGRFGLYDHIRFRQTVERADREAAGGWRVTFSGGGTRTYAALVVAAGVHWVPSTDDLFILGMIQPDSGVWPLMDLQARAVASYIRAAGAKLPGIRRVRALKQGPRADLSGGIRYVKSERHRYEVEHSSYARHLRKVIRLLES